MLAGPPTISAVTPTHESAVVQWEPPTGGNTSAFNYSISLAGPAVSPGPWIVNGEETNFTLVQLGFGGDFTVSVATTDGMEVSSAAMRSFQTTTVSE